MARKFSTMTLSILLIAVTAACVKADEVTELKKMLAEQSLLLKKLENRINQLEDSQDQQQQMVEDKLTEVQAPAPTAIPEPLQWASKMRFYGDFRYRHETTDVEGSDNRNRHRIRFRLGMESMINDQWTLGLRLVSGGDDPVSTNQTLDNTFSTKDIRLDRAFVEWNPNQFDGYSMKFGKFSVPFYRPGGTELFWDGDLSVEGIAANYDFELSDSLSGWVTGAGLWVDEVGDGADVALFGGQAAFKQQLTEDTHLTAGAGFYGYNNVEGANLYGDDTFGNTSTADPEILLYEYNLVEIFAEVSTLLGETPASIFFDYAYNAASGVDQDTGWLVGAKYGKAKAPGTWHVAYNYRDLEEDAVLAVVTDSDFIGGGTGGSGHELNFTYAISRNFFAGVSYFLNEIERDGDSLDFDRLQIDLMYKF